MSFSKFTIKDNRQIKEARESLMTLVRRRCPDAEEQATVERALRFVGESHKNIRRNTGEPYIIHPIEVAKIVITEIGLGYKSICAALLHDVFEDTGYDIEDIRSLFGDTIAALVEGMVKIKNVLDDESRKEYKSTENLQAENFRKILLTLSDDVRVILIKLADRLHSCRTLEAQTPRKRDKILSDIMYIFVPLAHRLGLYGIKSEMENTWLRYRRPEQWADISGRIERSTAICMPDIENFIDSVREMLDAAGIKYTIRQRVKTPYSIWYKMTAKEVSFDEIFDLYATRIIFTPKKGAEEHAEARRIYTLLRKAFPEKPERLRNWLDKPKSNGYEALHCTLQTQGGNWVEVQIRSRRMDDIAERGIAAHWAYKKEGFSSEENSEMDKWLSRLQHILSARDSDITTLLDMMHKGLTSPEVVLFTQSGEQRTLPSGSTVLDFAYSIHSDIGNKAIAAKVNGHLCDLDTTLSSGDRIEIITARNGAPQQQWLGFLHTKAARSRVSEYLRKAKKLVPLLIFALIFLPIIFAPSCANTTQSPTGGPKDSIPPYITNIVPLPGSLNVPTARTKIVFTFNEFVTIKDAKSIYLSPPLSKPAKARIMGKNLVVTFEEDLLPNTTYTLDLTGALADNNEGNMYPGYTYVFSTGERIDSLYITGIVQECTTLKPVKGATVMLYKNHADSAIFLERPIASVRTDDWGYFSLAYLQDTLYRLYAIKDDASDNIYDPQADLIAFYDSLVQPVLKVNDTVPELMKYEMKDTAACLARKTRYTLNLFRERPTKQYIVNKVRVKDRSSYITFMAPGAWIDSLWIKGYPDKRVITQFNIQQDSLEIWVNDPRPVPDTLHLYVNYRKTDTTGALKPHLEHVKLYREGMKRKAVGFNARKEIKHEDTICVFKLDVKGETVEQKGFDLEFQEPIIYENFDKLDFIMVNPKQKMSKGKFDVEKDSLNLRHFTIRPREKLLNGWEYRLKLPHRAFQDINGFFSDSTEVKVTLPTDENLSSLELVLSDVPGKVLVDLLNEARKEVLRSYVIDGPCTLQFPYLRKGKYCIRFTEDLNRNSIVDTGSLLEHRQPEKVRFLKINGDIFLDLPEKTELSQKASVSEIFKD